MTILLSDPQVRTIPVRDDGSGLVAVDFAPRVLVRAALAERLASARGRLPAGVDLHLVEGHRSIESQRSIIDRYSAELRLAYPDADEAEIHRLSSRFVSPIEVAPHVAGGAIDLTLVDADGHELAMGTPIDATPEDSDGACFFAAPVGAEERRNRDLLASVLRAEGLVNYPTEWWHWSFGDRYWALVTGAPHALYGPVVPAVVA